MSQEFVISRSYEAPREEMWKAWTEADRLAKWFSPKGTTTRIARFDLKPGGMCHYAMKGPEGPEMWGKAVYREIKKPDRLVSVISFSDESAGMTRHPMAPTWPREMLTTVEFKEEGPRKTNVTVRWLPLDPDAEETKIFDESHDNMRMGWTGTLDQLGDYLADAR
jgi:uncharacterized protein YndB with AHSA1/START domain